jgi:hypothetical protein
MTLITLCLAPLLAHVLAGTPKPVLLSHRPPPWQDLVCRFNPTTILWRYFVIAERRLRAKSWTNSDMAASNAVFWTNAGWDGSEEMMKQSRGYALRLPKFHRVKLISGSLAATLVVFLQGVMALKTLVGGFSNSGNSTPLSATINFSTIFFPLSVLGLLRLVPALWLSEDHLYYFNDSVPRKLSHAVADSQSGKFEESVPELRLNQTMSLLNYSSTSVDEQFYPANSWRAIMFRIFFLIPVCGLLGICIGYIATTVGSPDLLLTTTALMLVITYTYFLAGTFTLFLYYFFALKTSTTIIPCLTSAWYRIYTLGLAAIVLLLITFAALETRKTPCGIYTTLPNIPELLICPDALAVLSNASQGAYGISFLAPLEAAGTLNSTANALHEGPMRTVVMAFNGWCIGSLTTPFFAASPINGTFNDDRVVAGIEVSPIVPGLNSSQYLSLNYG